MTTAPRSPRLLVLSAVVLAAAGIALLGMPHGHEPPAPASRATTDPASAAAVTPARQPIADTAPSTMPTASTPSVPESALPPHGEGVAGDPAVHEAFLGLATCLITHRHVQRLC